MSDAPKQNQMAGRIEGGIDAVVLGANADGLAAAAYLGRAGLKTVLLEEGAEIGGAVRERKFDNGLAYTDGDNLISILDPLTADDLELYRYGLSYAARCLDTAYFFEDGETLHFDGDLSRAGAETDAEENRDLALQAFIVKAMEAGMILRPAFEAAADGSKAFEKAMRAAPAALARRINDYLIASADDVLDASFPDGPVKTALLSETAFACGTAPNEAFSFMSLVRRWAGEASGLQGALAYPKGGAVALIHALRRSAQAARVDIRAATPISSILIEQDRAAGVEISGGGQIRAPIIIAAGDAKRTFMRLIGPAHLDLEFQQSVAAPSSPFMSAWMHLALKGVARDEKTKGNMRRRLLYAPPPHRLKKAFADARAGDIPEDLVIEAIFPADLDEEAPNEKAHLLSLKAHPLPFMSDCDEDVREKIEAAIFANLEKFAPEIGERVEEKRLSLPEDLAKIAGASPSAFASRPSIIRQYARAHLAASAGNIGGLYFCGPEAQIGDGLSCTAGRLAAKKAIRDYKRGDRI